MSDDRRYEKDNVDALYNLALLVASQCKTCPRGTDSAMCQYCYSSQARFTLEAMTEKPAITMKSESKITGSTVEARINSAKNRSIVLESITKFGSSGATSEMIDIDSGIRNYNNTMHVLRTLINKKSILMVKADRQVFFPIGTPIDYALEQAKTFKRNRERKRKNATDMEG